MKKEIIRIIKATNYSISGLISAWSEPAFKTECMLSLILIPIALLLPINMLPKALVLLSMVIILITELINIAIEETVNYISLQKHPLAKKIKDVASAAVFIALLFSLSMWIWALLDFTHTIN